MPVPSCLSLPAPASVSARKRRSSRLLVVALAAVLVLPGTGPARAADRPVDGTPPAAPLSVPASLVAEPVPVDPGTARRFEVALYRAKERFGFHSVELAVLGREGRRVGGWTFAGHSGLLGHDTTLLVWIPQRQVAIAVIVNRPSSQVDDLLAYRHGDDPSLLALAMELAR